MPHKGALVIVDCEGHGPAAGLNNHEKFEFGAVEFETRQTFHGHRGTKETFDDFARWLDGFGALLIFVSDNPAYDWQFINYYFHKFRGANPFGHSARRIGDFYAGLVRNFRAPGRDWKKLRKTVHDHNPVNDAMGNVEALAALFGQEKDWTRNADGRSNASPTFVKLVHEVEKLIRGEAHALLAGHAEQAAGLIVAQLAHVHGLAPVKVAS